MRCAIAVNYKGMAIDKQEELIQSERSVQKDVNAVSQLPVSSGEGTVCGDNSLYREWKKSLSWSFSTATTDGFQCVTSP
jgi:hypothetical protein